MRIVIYCLIISSLLFTPVCGSAEEEENNREVDLKGNRSLSEKKSNEPVSKEDKEVIKILEILADLEFLEHFDLSEDLEYLKDTITEQDNVQLED